MITRKNQASLTQPEKDHFVDAVRRLKANGKYDQFVSWHRDTIHIDPNTGKELKDAHEGPAFFAWHREFLIRFEKALQDAVGDPNLGLPYWDWSVNRSQDSGWPFTPDFLGGDGRASDGRVIDGKFSDWTLTVLPPPDDPDAQYTYLRRQFGKDPDATTLPTPDDVKAALNATPFDVAPWSRNSQSGFRNMAEGFIPQPTPGVYTIPRMHNRVHAWIGGSMGPPTSPNDPVFFLHHCFVDKLWADRLTSHPNEAGYLPDSGAPQGHNYDDPMRPWNKPGDTVRPSDVVNWHYHSPDGYSYCYDLEVPMLSGLVHLQDRGDMGFFQYSFAGTRGEGRRLEGFEVDFEIPVEGLGMEYMAHIQEQGDTPWVQGGKFVGTRGQARRLEGFAIWLTGPRSSNYDVYYMAHLEGTGDTPFYQNGQFCGTRGQARRVEGIEVRVVPNKPYEPGRIVG
jgi:tyrosinase